MNAVLLYKGITGLQFHRFLLTYSKDFVSEITDYDTHGRQGIDFSATVEAFVSCHLTYTDYETHPLWRNTVKGAKAVGACKQ